MPAPILNSTGFRHVNREVANRKQRDNQYNIIATPLDVAMGTAMTDNKTLPTTVAICAIARNESTYIEEWVEFHRRQGVTLFRVYDNGSSDGKSEVLRKLGIEPKSWTEHTPQFDNQQRAAYVDGARVLTGHATWAAFIDIDEFLFGRDRINLAETLAGIPADVGAVAVQQRVFGSGGQPTRLPGGVVERFTRCAGHQERHWFKSIARPEQIVRFDSVHSVVLRTGSYILSDGSPLEREVRTLARRPEAWMARSE